MIYKTPKKESQLSSLDFHILKYFQEHELTYFFFFYVGVPRYTFYVIPSLFHPYIIEKVASFLLTCKHLRFPFT